MTTAMLKWAKTKSAFKDQKNVKDAKTFSDLTPTKQKVITRQYEARLQKKALKKAKPKMKPPPIPPNVKGKKIKPPSVPKKKARKPPTRLYTMEGWGLIDDDTEEEGLGTMAWGLEEYGFEISQTYPSGLQAFTARLTKQQIKDFDKDHGENYEDHTRLYYESNRKGITTRNMIYDFE
tara:strand:- start:47 stop:580 length:534 start_codon:yes stop_codon:yes gene_type:complete